MLRSADFLLEVSANLFERVGYARRNPQFRALEQAPYVFGWFPTQEPVLLGRFLDAIPRQAQQQTSFIRVLALVPQRFYERNATDTKSGVLTSTCPSDLLPFTLEQVAWKDAFSKRVTMSVVRLSWLASAAISNGKD